MIKAILFDVDQVLVNVEGRYFSVHLAEQYNIPISVTAEFFETEFMECIVGQKDLKEVLPKYMKKWGWKGTLDDLLYFWFTSEHTLNEQLINEFELYKKLGIKIYLATNQEKYRTKYILEEMGFEKIVDGIFASGHMGHRKPEREYFETIIENLSLYKPQELLFWDDREENIRAAQYEGIRAEQYTSFDDFKQKMDNYLNNGGIPDL